MLIRLGYDIRFELPAPVPMVAMLNVHPSRANDLRQPDELKVDPTVAVEQYVDGFGNICCRLTAPAGPLRLWNSTLIEDSGQPDAQNCGGAAGSGGRPTGGNLQYLISSRYCEVDLSVQHGDGTVWRYRAGMGPSAGGVRLGASQGHFRISVRTPDQNRAGRLHRANLASAAIFSISPSPSAAV